MTDKRVRIREAIVVEGKYDKIKLSSVVDALILETHGFRIFKDKELLNLLRRLADQRGLLVLTDSDSAGFVIRDYLSGAIPPSQIKHAYIPQLVGRERRKCVPSKEMLLGVEGIDGKVLADALRRAGATIECETTGQSNEAPLTKLDMYEAGLAGKPGSSERRRILLSLLSLPKMLSCNRLLEVLNATMTRSDFIKLIDEFQW